jgi:4-amino-4-deoxy-L-arabinose transferase-like glycosyltransferase
VRRWTPAIVFLSALVVRLVVTFELNGTAIFRTPQLDSFEYYSWALRIASGDFTWPAAPPHGPGYPYFLGLLLVIGRGSILAVHVMQAVLGAVTAVVIALIARRVYGDYASLIAGLFTATYAPLALIDVSLYAEGLLVFLLSCSLLALVSLESRPALIAFLCGTALGVAIIVRPTAAILIPIYVWQLWRHARRALIVFAIAVLYPIVPVLVHNWSETGDLLAIQSGGGFNFYIGNEPSHDGTAWARPGGTWDWARGEAWRAGVRGAALEDHYYFRRALLNLHGSLFLSKAFWFLQNEEIRDSHSFYYLQKRSSFLHLPQFGMILSLAAIGVFSKRRNPATWLLLAYVVAMSITVVVFVVGSRYRIPVMPALLVLTGGIVGAMPNRRAVVPLIIFFTTLVVSAIWQHRPSHDFAEEWAMEGIALGKEGQFAAANSAFRRSLALNPRLAIGWTGLGDLAMRQGRVAEAERLYMSSLNVDPRHALTWRHFALARAASGDRESAKQLLQRALAIRADRDAMYTLAGFLFADRDMDGAERWLREVLRMNPDDEQARIALERTRAERFRH